MDDSGFVYNFIGAFDFEAATAQAEANEKRKENGIVCTTPFSI